MSKLITALIASVVLMGLQTSALAATAQQMKMKACNADAKAKDLKGPDRKAFMKDCLSAKKEEAAPAATEAAAAPSEQKNKMKTCNADAKTKDLKGAERKAFMKDCLSAKK
jgi:hypothetical protein